MADLSSLQGTSKNINREIIISGCEIKFYVFFLVLFKEETIKVEPHLLKNLTAPSVSEGEMNLESETEIVYYFFLKLDIMSTLRNGIKLAEPSFWGKFLFSCIEY